MEKDIRKKVEEIVSSIRYLAVSEGESPKLDLMLEEYKELRGQLWNMGVGPRNYDRRIEVAKTVSKWSNKIFIR